MLQGRTKELIESDSRQLLEKIDPQNLPRHVAIIMDGNGRWAKKRFLPRVAGHRVGIKVVHDIVETASDLGIKVLTLYAFSVENWKRPPQEVSALMKFLVEFLRKEFEMMMKNRVRFQAIGRIQGLPDWVQDEIRHTEAETGQNKGLLLNVALNYSSQTEILDAVRNIAAKVKQGDLLVDDINEQVIEQHLYTAGIPDPDLLIRTSGELRISNFLLWQLAYAEIWITQTLWPDFSPEEFYQAILDYQKRERRFGTIGKLNPSS